MISNKKRTLYIVLILVIAAAMALQFVLEGAHHLGLYVLIGFVGGWCLIILGKLILGPLLQRDENYYGDLDLEAGDGAPAAGGHGPSVAGKGGDHHA